MTNPAEALTIVFGACAAAAAVTWTVAAPAHMHRRRRQAATDHHLRRGGRSELAGPGCHTPQTESRKGDASPSRAETPQPASTHPLPAPSRPAGDRQAPDVTAPTFHPPEGRGGTSPNTPTASRRRRHGA